MIMGGGNNRGVQEFWVKGHLGIIWGHCSKMLLLHDSIEFDETWVKRSLATGLSGFSGIFGWRSSWGHLGSLQKYLL